MWIQPSIINHDQTLWRLEKKCVGYKRARYPGIPSLCSAQDRVAPNLPHVRLNHCCVGLVGLVSNDENQHFPPQKRDPCKSQTSSYTYDILGGHNFLNTGVLENSKLKTWQGDQVYFSVDKLVWKGFKRNIRHRMAGEWNYSNMN